MLKQYGLIIGLGLALSLAACAQTETEFPASDITKTESSEAEKRPEGQRPQQGQRGDGQRRTPPEAAFAACASLAAQSACSVETPRGTRAGVCRTRPGDDRAFCAPQRPEGGRGEGRGEGRPRAEGQ